MDYILEVENLSKDYKKGDFQLKNISFKLPQGYILGLIGENGSGKTTTLSIILNLKKKKGGIVKLFGKTMDINDVEMKEKIGMVFDMNCFPTTMTSKGISKVFSKIYKNWDESYFFKTLERFNIPINKKIKEYSKGMLMTLSIVVALSYHPQLLVLDEATSGLDPVRREEMLDLFLEFIGNGKNSIIFSSHITNDIEKIADFVSFIHQGETFLNDEKDNLIYNYGIMRCGKEQFLQLEKEEVVRYLRKDYEYRILISKKKKFENQYPNIIIDNPSLEEIIYLISKGERP